MTAGDALEVTRPEEDEIDALTAIQRQSLHRSFIRDDWAYKLGVNRLWVVRDGGEIAGVTGVLDMGQWFGGRSVPMGGVTAVGVAPEYRGRGTASVLMRRALEELYAQGVPLSTLYASTVNFYRKLGYELAGVKMVYQMPTRLIDVKERPLDVVPIDSSAHEEIYHTYTQRAQATSGNADRPSILWEVILGADGRDIYKYLFTRDGSAEGYVVFQQSRGADHIRVRDVAVTTRDAAIQILKFFSDHRSTIDTFSWNGSPNDSIAFLHSEEDAEPIRTEPWMMRVVDVEKALEARGYPVNLEGELHLQVEDGLLPWNNDRFRIAVSGGKGEVRTGGEGRLRIGVRGLAAMYTGHMTASDLKLVDALEGPDSEIDMANLVFSGPRPWMPDQF